VKEKDNESRTRRWEEQEEDEMECHGIGKNTIIV
jgi:hypothetical protein